MDVQLPDGRILKGVPDGTTKAELSAKLAKNGIGFDAAPKETPESEGSDVAKTVASMPERMAAGAAMALPNIINQAVTGPQMLYRGLTGRERDNSPLWQPFYGSEDVLQKLPESVRPHTPTTAAGKAADVIGNIATQVATGRGQIIPAARAVSRPITKAAGTLATKAIPAIDEGLLPVVKMAQKYKIPLSLDEVTGSRALKTAQKAGQDLPFSGQQAFREKQMSSWNRALLNTVGAKGDKITPEVMNQSFKRLGAQFEKLGKGKAFTLDDSFAREIDAIRQNAKSTTSKDAIENFENEVANLFKETNSGAITGEKLNKFRAKVNEHMRDTDNYDTKKLLSQLENQIIEVMTKGDANAAKDFAKTKQQYKNLLAIEPLVKKGKAGNISPIQLSTTVGRIYGRAYATGQAGEIGELARIGRELLPELGGSDTQAKAVYSLGAMGGALSHPFITSAVLGGNRAFQGGINRNQSLIQRLIRQAAQQPTP